MHWRVLGAGRAGEEASWLPGRPGVSHPLGQRRGARPHHLPHPQLRLRPPGVRQRLGARHRGLHPAQVGHSQASCQFISLSLGAARHDEEVIVNLDLSKEFYFLF